MKEILECLYVLSIVIVLGVSMCSLDDQIKSLNRQIQSVEKHLSQIEKKTNELETDLECTNVICQKIMQKEW